MQPTVPLNFLHCTHCTTPPLHCTENYVSPPLHFAALQPHYLIKFYCTASTALYSLHFTPTTEKRNIASEKNNYNFRRANFDAMRTELYTFEQPYLWTTIPLNNLFIETMPRKDLKFSRAESMMQAEDTSRKDEPPSTIYRGSTMMSNRLLEGGRKPMKQKEESTMKKLSQDTLKLKDKSREL